MVFEESICPSEEWKVWRESVLVRLFSPHLFISSLTGMAIQQQTGQIIPPVTSLLSDKAILRYREQGKIVIHPFNPDNLGTSSYDVTLGPYFFRESTPEPGQGFSFFK